VVNELRHIEGVKIVEIQREEPKDEISCDLMPMVREYLTISGNPERKPEEEYVYDVYVHHEGESVNDVLEQNRVATLQLNDDVIYLNEEGPDSDFDSNDSNGTYH
jgi:hypothetical protein